MKRFIVKFCLKHQNIMITLRKISESLMLLAFIALVTAHIPPKHKQLIRRYGLYASRTRGKWETQDHLVRLAPVGWKEKKRLEEKTPAESVEKKNPVGTKQQMSAWARLIKKVYGIDLLCCPKCNSDMKTTCDYYESGRN